MGKRVGNVLAAVLLVMHLGLNASAAEKGGSIRIFMDVGDLPVTNGAMAVHYVGSKAAEGYRITDAFGGGMVKEEDALSPQLARWLAEMAGEGTKVLLDADGNVTFSNLEEGLYLLTQTEKIDGFYAVDPFLLTIPLDGRFHLQVNPVPEPIVTDLVQPDNPRTGEDPLLVLSLFGVLLSGTGLWLCAAAKYKK